MGEFSDSDYNQTLSQQLLLPPEFPSTFHFILILQRINSDEGIRIIIQGPSAVLFNLHKFEYSEFWHNSDFGLEIISQLLDVRCSN